MGGRPMLQFQVSGQVGSLRGGGEPSVLGLRGLLCIVWNGNVHSKEMRFHCATE